jgi:hypothetical protein
MIMLDRMRVAKGLVDRSTLERTGVRYPAAGRLRQYHLVDIEDERPIGTAIGWHNIPSATQQGYCCAILEKAAVLETVMQKGGGLADFYWNGEHAGQVRRASAMAAGGSPGAWHICEPRGAEFGLIKISAQVGPGALVITRDDGHTLPLNVQMSRSFTDFVKVLGNTLSLGWLVGRRLFAVSADALIDKSACVSLPDEGVRTYFATALCFRMLIYPFDFVLSGGD